MRRLFFCSESFTVSLLSLRSCFSWRGRAQSFCGKPEGHKGDGEEVLKILQKNSLAAFPLRALLFLLDMVLHTPFVPTAMMVGPDYAQDLRYAEIYCGNLRTQVDLKPVA
jgi:hypothetical protein